jgi:8-oxo-dGTP diphosphatase
VPIDAPGEKGQLRTRRPAAAAAPRPRQRSDNRAVHTLHIATACIFNAVQELLVVRKRGTSKWMLPGGKLDHGETPAQALVRELHEELRVTLSRADLQALGHFHASAANEVDTQVSAHAFVATLPSGQTVQIAAEIEALDWKPLDALQSDQVAPLLRQHIVPALRQVGPHAR